MKTVESLAAHVGCAVTDIDKLGKVSILVTGRGRLFFCCAVLYSYAESDCVHHLYTRLAGRWVSVLCNGHEYLSYI